MTALIDGAVAASTALGFVCFSVTLIRAALRRDYPSGSRIKLLSYAMMFIGCGNQCFISTYRLIGDPQATAVWMWAPGWIGIGLYGLWLRLENGWRL